jgi:hypothetical protein
VPHVKGLISGNVEPERLEGPGAEGGLEVREVHDN